MIVVLRLVITGIAIGVVVVSAGESLAAAFQMRCPVAGSQANFGCTILLTGKIERGDAERLTRILQNPPRTSDIYRELVLNSTGGEVVEALRLSELVRAALLETRNQSLIDLLAYSSSVREGKATTTQSAFPCISACFLVLMSGPKRSFSPFGNGKVGLHRPFFSPQVYSNLDPGTIATRQAEAMQRVTDVLRREGVPTKFVDEMMRRSSRDVYWLTYDDWTQIPSTAFWYEELLIARCNFDPTAETRVVAALTRGDFGTAEALKGKLIADAACERSVIRDAQEKIRVRAISPQKDGRWEEVGKPRDVPGATSPDRQR